MTFGLIHGRSAAANVDYPCEQPSYLEHCGGHFLRLLAADCPLCSSQPLLGGFFYTLWNDDAGFARLGAEVLDSIDPVLATGGYRPAGWSLQRFGDVVLRAGYQQSRLGRFQICSAGGDSVHRGGGVRCFWSVSGADNHAKNRGIGVGCGCSVAVELNPSNPTIAWRRMSPSSLIEPLDLRVKTPAARGSSFALTNDY